MTYPAPLDPEWIIKTLAKHNVSYILVGALAARLHGMPRMTADADLTPDKRPENLERLAAALKELGARVFTDGVPEGLAFDCSATTLAQAGLWNFTTAAGRLDLVFKPSGTEGYPDLLRNADEIKVYGVKLRLASLPDLIRTKKASDRPQDRQDVIVLQEILQSRSPR